MRPLQVDTLKPLREWAIDLEPQVGWAHGNAGIIREPHQTSGVLGRYTSRLKSDRGFDVTRYRLSWVAAAVFTTVLIGCGSTSTAPSQSGGTTPSGGSTSQPAQTPAPFTAQIVFSGALTGTLALNAAESSCELLPSGSFMGTFDGVVPGSEAGFTILEPPGTNTLTAGDEVGLDTSINFWHSDISGTVTITVTGKTATGMVTADIAGQTGSGVSGTVADLHVTGSFSCPLQASAG